MKYILLREQAKELEERLTAVKAEIRKQQESPECINCGGANVPIVDSELVLLKGERAKLSYLLSSAEVLDKSKGDCQNSETDKITYGDFVRIKLTPLDIAVDPYEGIVKMVPYGGKSESVPPLVSKLSPLGEAIYDHEVGQVVKYVVPGYGLHVVEILEIVSEAVKTPSESSPAPYVKKK